MSVAFAIGGSVLMQTPITSYQVNTRHLDEGTYALVATGDLHDYGSFAGDDAIDDSECELHTWDGSLIGAAAAARGADPGRTKMSLSMNGAANIPAGDGDISLWCQTQLGGGASVDNSQIMIIKHGGFFERKPSRSRPSGRLRRLFRRCAHFHCMMQFRGHATWLEPGVVLARATAPSSALVTLIDSVGVHGSLEVRDGDEAHLECRLTFRTSATSPSSARSASATATLSLSQRRPGDVDEERRPAAPPRCKRLGGGRRSRHLSKRIGQIVSNFLISDSGD